MLLILYMHFGFSCTFTFDIQCIRYSMSEIDSILIYFYFFISKDLFHKIHVTNICPSSHHACHITLNRNLINTVHNILRALFKDILSLAQGRRPSINLSRDKMYSIKAKPADKLPDAIFVIKD